MSRLVSINVVPDVDAPSELDTHHVMQWGQFVDHDITHTPLFRSPPIPRTLYFEHQLLQTF